MYRSSHQDVSCKKDVLRNFAKFTGKHLCQSLFFNKVYMCSKMCPGFIQALTDLRLPKVKTQS